MAAQALGKVTIGSTVYEVSSLGVGDGARAAGILGNYSFVGPKGACYFVTDHGPKYLINSVALGTEGRRCAPRQLRGLTREHLLPLIAAQAAPVVEAPVRRVDVATDCPTCGARLTVAADRDALTCEDCDAFDAAFDREVR